jgi:hypothetical protein
MCADGRSACLPEELDPLADAGDGPIREEPEDLTLPQRPHDGERRVGVHELQPIVARARFTARCIRSARSRSAGRSVAVRDEDLTDDGDRAEVRGRDDDALSFGVRFDEPLPSRAFSDGASAWRPFMRTRRKISR